MSATDASQQANRAGMDPKRLVVISYLVFGLIIALFLGHLFELVGGKLNLGRSEPIEVLGWTWSQLLGFVAAAGLGAFCWVNPKVRSLSTEVASELMRVTWPSFEETRVSTIAVVVASLVASVILFGIDTLAYELMVGWLPKLWGKF